MVQYEVSQSKIYINYIFILLFVYCSYLKNDKCILGEGRGETNIEVVELRVEIQIRRKLISVIASPAPRLGERKCIFTIVREFSGTPAEGN